MPLCRWIFLLLSYSVSFIRSQSLRKCNWCRFVNVYPKQYDTLKLNENEAITIDGYLNESSWIQVPFTTSAFVDIAQLLYNSSINGFRIPNNYSTKVKLRWDASYLYIGAILYEPFVFGSITGHNNAPNVPYLDHDFEIFIDPSGSNYFYKEFEINVLNATYDVMWHKTQPIPCNNTHNNSITNKNWCSDTTYNNNGNWSMYDYKSADGLKAATSIQRIANHSKQSICDVPCTGCPDEPLTATPNAWCPWSYLTTDCNKWPQILTESWTVEIRMPLKHSDDYNYGGLLDTDNITLNEQFIKEYNPNSFQNLSEYHVFWWIDFARTEHPLGYNQDSIWSVVENQTVLHTVLSIYPTLLGEHRWNNYWEWSWNAVGITKYMHYPQFWGMLKFIEEEHDTQCLNIEWPARYLLYSLWWANYEYFMYNKGLKYALHVEELLNDRFCKFGYCDLNALTQAVYYKDSCFVFNMEIDSERGCVNFMGGNMTLEQKLYSGICYHANVVVYVDDNKENDYMVNITESHLVSVSGNNHDLCL